ncbi:hypothetical protein XENOCAPTIV_004915 [Xenoophorus captivus]|uniref:Uncharacterized protein n=1 Tax=Xenoophorus captivus TaxID=1517983 RepID=A0ABV0QH96_9TELE
MYPVMLETFHHLLFGYKVFESVEAESMAEGEEIPPIDLVKTTDDPQPPISESSTSAVSNQHPVPDNATVPESANEPTASQQTAEVSETFSEEITTESEPAISESARQDAKLPDLEEEALIQKKEINLESEAAAETGINKSKESSAAESKNLMTHGVGKEVNTNINLKSTPKNTNVLKLETEIHNEYFQAPPLGETLTLQTHKIKDLEGERSCPETSTDNIDSQSDTKPQDSKKPEDTESTVCNFAETKKAAEVELEKPDSNSPVRQVLNALQTASRGGFSLSSHSPDAVDSDDSLSALEMEDIPAGITCVTSEDIKPRPLIGLAAPPISLAQREKMASERLAQDHHLDTACNISPECTDLGLSEEEAEMDNVLTEPESGVMGGVTKYEESSEEQTYSVSIVQCKDIVFLCYKHTLTTLPSFFFFSKKHSTCT